MESEPYWLTFDDLVRIHADQLERHGGLDGFKDQGLVESASFAPQNLYYYEGQEDILALAIRLCRSVAKNHGFNDGNKRTGAFAMIEFLALNGYDLFVPDDDPDEPLLGLWVAKLTADEYDEHQLYDRLEHFLQEVPED